MMRKLFFILVINSLIGCMTNQAYISYQSTYKKNGTLVTDNLYIDSVTYNLISGDLLIPHENCTSAQYFCIKGELINVIIPKCKGLNIGDTWTVNSHSYLIEDALEINNETTYFIKVVEGSSMNQLDSFTYRHRSGVMEMKISYGDENLTYSIKGRGIFPRRNC